MTYVIAIRREARAATPEDLLDRLCSWPGVVELSRNTAGDRRRVEMEAATAAEMQAQHGAHVHIEEETRYRTS